MNAPTTVRHGTEHRVDANPARTYSLPARYYTDPALFRRELDAIFYREWWYVGHASQFRQAGDYATTLVYDQNIAVVKGSDGVLRAFFNVCRHRGHELLRGSGNLTRAIVCPYHAWSYGFDGSLRNARGSETLENFDRSEFGLVQVPVEEFLGFVFINLDPEAAPLAPRLEGLAEEIRERVAGFDELVVYEAGEGIAPRGEVQCNWKVVSENFLECYHCQPAHPTLRQRFDVKTFRTVNHEHWSRGDLDILPTVDSPAFRVRPDHPQRDGWFWYVWPNVTFSTVPGSPNMTIWRMDPLGPEVCANWIQTLRMPGNPDADDLARDQWGKTDVGVEDIKLCESVQRGLRQRGYRQGRLVAGDPERGIPGEIGVHWFQHRVQSALEG